MSSLKPDFPAYVKSLWLADVDLNTLNLSIKEFEQAFAIYIGLDITFMRFIPSKYGDLNHLLMSNKLDRRLKP